MAKISYICKECGHKSGKWFGKCTACGQWDTCVEELEVKPSKKTPQNFIPKENKAAVSIHEISTEEEIRIDLGSGEFNRVLGGGLVAGSLVLIGGEQELGNPHYYFKQYFRSKIIKYFMFRERKALAN